MPIHTGTVLRDYTPRISVQKYLKQFADKAGTDELAFFEGFLSTSKNPLSNLKSKIPQS
ncbi:MAG: hypothetical protein JSR00_05190 [Bacteroidetes bacterium]|nr:hypothetical protein [Bacteroidota bacterium]